MSWRRGGLVLALAFALALAPRIALAHAEVVFSDPSSGALVATPPAAVSVRFSQAVKPFGHGLVVISPTGTRVDGGRVEVAGDRLSVGLDGAREGTYVVTYQVIAADSHPSRGSFVFSIGHPTRPAITLQATSALGVLVEVAARWLHFAGFALGFGSVAFRMLLVPAGRRRLDRLAGVGVILLIAAEPVALVAQTASLSPGDALDPASLEDALASNFGRLQSLRLAAALMLWALLGARGQAPRFAGTAILALGGLLALVDGSAAHAQGVLPAPAAILVNAAHVATMAVWAGGLAGLLAARPVSPATSLGFGRMALPAFGIAVLAGAVLGATEIVSLRYLASTAFGLALLAKVVIVGLGAIAALGSRRGHRRAWTVEAVAVAGIILVAGLLAALPPPRAL